MRRSLILAGLLLLLVCQTSFAAPATTPALTAVEPYDAKCGVSIPDGVIVRSLPDPDTCVGPMSDQLKALADTRNSDLAPPIEPKVTNTPSESGQSATTTLDTGNYDAKCGVPVPDGVIIRSLPDPDTCVGPLSDKLKSLADTRNPNLAPPPEPKSTKLSRAQTGAAPFGNMQSPTTNTYETGNSGYGIYSNGDSNGILSYLGANYPYNVQMPADNHQFNIWSEAIQPTRSCLYNAIIHERNDYVHYLSGQADRIIYGNSCTATVNYAWGLNDPGVQQQIIITTGTGPVAAGQVKEVSPGCFNSYVYNKVTSTWNFVAQACQIDNLYPQGYVQWAATALGQTPLWCPVLPTHPWVEATLKLHNGVWQAPNPSTDWAGSQSSNCVVNGDSYIVTSLIVDPLYGAYVTWANQ